MPLKKCGSMFPFLRVQQAEPANEGSHTPNRRGRGTYTLTVLTTGQLKKLVWARGILYVKTWLLHNSFILPEYFVSVHACVCVSVCVYVCVLVCMMCVCLHELLCLKKALSIRE